MANTELVRSSLLKFKKSLESRKGKSVTVGMINNYRDDVLDVFTQEFPVPVVNPPVVDQPPVTGDIVISSPQTFTGKSFNGAVTVTTPDVTFDGCKFTCSYPDATLLTAYHRTKVNNCDFTGSPNGQHRGIRTDATGIRITNTRIKNIWWDIDTQAIGGWDGTKDLVVDGCELEASGENILFGGATLSSQDNICSDILIQNCKIYKNPAWKSKPGGVTCKNLFELKAAVRVTFQNNTLQYSWVDGQEGYAILLTLRQDPRPWGRLSDIKILNNKIDSVAGCFNMLGVDDQGRQPNDPMMENVLIQGNEFTNVNVDNTGGRCFVLLNGSKNLQIINNTVKGSNIKTAFSIGDDPTLKHTGLVITGNRLPEGLYGIAGGGAPALGKAVLDMYAPGYVWSNNVITGHIPQQYVVWPTGTTFE